MTTLQVLIFTHGRDGLERVKRQCLPAVDGVRYLVVCQAEKTEWPHGRDDLEIIFNDTIGLSNNRNRALKAATAPYMLIADDDVDYSAGGLAELVKRLNDSNVTDIITVRVTGSGSGHYPTDNQKLGLTLKRHYPPSFEIALRTAAIRGAGLWFSPIMGIGAPVLTSGEENMFVDTALRRGLTASHHNVTIGHHNGASAQDRVPTAGELMSRGAVLRLCYRHTYLLRAIRLALMLPTPTLRALSEMRMGAKYALSHSAEIKAPHPAD